jgi:hypothetical protein
VHIEPRPRISPLTTMQTLDNRSSKWRRAGSAVLATCLTLPPSLAHADDPVPAAEPDQSMATLEGPSPDEVLKGPRVRLEVKGGRALSLYGVESEFVGYGSGSGGTVAVHGMSFRRLCDAPCDRHVRSGTGTYFVGGGPYTGSKRLQFPESGDITVQARPGHKALYFTGWVALTIGLPLLITGATLAGVGLGSKAMHGGLIGSGAFLVTASIPMFIFGRTRVKVR